MWVPLILNGLLSLIILSHRDVALGLGVSLSVP
jgi:hypothetical protein